MNINPPKKHRTMPITTEIKQALKEGQITEAELRLFLASRRAPIIATTHFHFVPGSTFLLPANDGSENIPESPHLFNSYLDPDFMKLKLNVNSEAQKEAAVNVYQLSKSSSFLPMLASFGTNLDSLCLTQHQIVDYCLLSPIALTPVGKNAILTLFLFKRNTDYFIAAVEKIRAGLQINVWPHSYEYILSAIEGHRLVIPQTAQITNHIGPSQTKHLRMLAAMPISINETSGERTIAESDRLFRRHIDHSFEKLGQSHIAVQKPKTRLCVYDLVKDGNFKDYFGSLPSNFDQLCLTQDQLIQFCEEYSEQFIEGYTVFFLLKESSYFQVAAVSGTASGLMICLHYFKLQSIWETVDKLRLVVPIIVIQR